MLTEGNTVTIKVRNALYDVRDRYANGWVGPEFNEYTGTVVHEKWYGSERIGLTTGMKSFPVRVIDCSRIVEVNGAVEAVQVPVENTVITKVVPGSKGNSYIVTKDGNKVSCTCPGFGFRKTCKHVQEVMA